MNSQKIICEPRKRIVANAYPATTDKITDAGTITAATMKLVWKLDANFPCSQAVT